MYVKNVLHPCVRTINHAAPKHAKYVSSAVIFCSLPVSRLIQVPCSVCGQSAIDAVNIPGVGTFIGQMTRRFSSKKLREAGRRQIRYWLSLQNSRNVSSTLAPGRLSSLISRYPPWLYEFPSNKCKTIGLAHGPWAWYNGGVEGRAAPPIETGIE